MPAAALPIDEPRPHAGLFVAFEGGEGAGKSTQATLLATRLLAAGHDVVRTREPGGTPAAEGIREVLLDRAHEGLDDRAEALLFAAARGDHVARVVRPALDRGAVVVTDRYLDSSVAYQGVGRGLGIETVEGLSLWATRGLRPDLTVVLDVDPTVGLGRLGTPDRLESEPAQFHRAVREGFVALAARDPGRYLVLDGTRPAPELAAEVAARVDTLLGARASSVGSAVGSSVESSVVGVAEQGSEGSA
ncbi:MAG: dTMP kinase [Candidatus Nanopelagicales bacterium]